MVARIVKDWDGAVVQTWLEHRIAAARADQVRAERGGRELQDDCDKATAEEMVCTLVKGREPPADAQILLQKLAALLDKDDYIWRGIYDDTRFDRHVRAFAKKLVRMVKTNDGFGNVAHYQ